MKEVGGASERFDESCEEYEGTTREASSPVREALGEIADGGCREEEGSESVQSSSVVVPLPSIEAAVREGREAPEEV